MWALGRVLWGAKQTCASAFANVELHLCTVPWLHCFSGSFTISYTYLSVPLGYLVIYWHIWTHSHFIKQQAGTLLQCSLTWSGFIAAFPIEALAKQLSKSDTEFQNCLRFFSIFSWPQKLSNIDPWVPLAKGLCRVGSRAAGFHGHRNISRCMASRCCAPGWVAMWGCPPWALPCPHSAVIPGPNVYKFCWSCCPCLCGIHSVEKLVWR